MQSHKFSECLALTADNQQVAIELHKNTQNRVL